MNNSCRLAYSIAIIAVVLLCAVLRHATKRVDVVERHVTDTVFITKIDTVVHTEIKCIKEVVVDTVYFSQKEIPLTITQKHYSRHGCYDLWVSGYKPHLDSIITYPKTIYRTITNETIKEMEINRTSLYAYLGFKHFHDEYIPSIGLMVKGRKNGLYGIEFGINGSNDVYWGISVGYKLK